MSRKIWIIAILGFVFLAGCRKASEEWVGVYTGTAGNDINQVIVSRVDNRTLRMELKVYAFGSYYTYTTLYNAKITTPKAITVNEDGAIALQTGTYHFAGSGTRDRNSITLSGTATNKSNPSDVKSYYFTGSK